MGFRRKSKRIIIRRLRRAGFFLLLAGLAGFQLQVRDREPPVVKIGNIKPYMNFSTIAIHGEIVVKPRRLRNGSILYSVDDGSGIIAIFSESASGSDTARVGDTIRAVGYLSIGAGNNVRLQVRPGEDVELKRARSEIKQPDLTSSVPQGSFMTVTGCVSRIWIPESQSRAPHRIVLDDGGGGLDVVSWLASPPSVCMGDVVEVTGKTQMYKDRLQIRLKKGTDIRVID